MSRAIKIVYEDLNFIAVNKPAGILVHKTAKNSDQETVVDWLIQNYSEIQNIGDNPKERPGIVHRLDKDTSGILVIAKNQSFFDHMKKLFQNHEVKKTYLALVWGKILSGGVINKPIGLRSGSVKRSIQYENLPTGRQSLKMIKEAITEYKPIKTYSLVGEGFTFLELIPKTGRTHQLRVHLASIHHPIVGDSLYGKKNNPWGLERQFLHAKSIEFTSEEGKRLKLEADLPEELQKILESL